MTKQEVAGFFVVVNAIVTIVVVVGVYTFNDLNLEQKENNKINPTQSNQRHSIPCIMTHRAKLCSDYKAV